MHANPVDFSDVQGLVRFGYRRLTEAAFHLLTIRDAAAARAWLRTAPVTNAMACDTAPSTALQVAFTAEGLRRLGVPPEVLAGFSPEFLPGLAGSDARSRLLGDVGASAPHLWRWGSPGSAPHVAVLLYAQPGRLHDWTAAVQGTAWDAAFTPITCLETSDLGGVEPFGFVDGVSQPALDWARERVPAGDQLTYSNVVSLGEFLLGYPNEYGRYTDRPLLAADDPAAAALPPAEDDPARRDLGRNGCYLVLRTLEQDVRGFWRFAERQSRASTTTHADAESAANAATPHAAAREALAEAMVGRHRNGDPLVPLSTEAIPGVDLATAPQNQFTFDADPGATRCPFGAHVRRANPRNADLPTPAVHGIGRLLHTLGLGHRDLHSDSKASTRFHRILRRGREYGTGVSADEALANDTDSGPHGIHFIALVANIARQFEFLQSAWMMSTKFDALSGESDPLLGNREPVPGCPAADTFSRPREDGVRDRISGLPQFVAVKGGAYFFLPSLGAIRYLAGLGDQTAVVAASVTAIAAPAQAAAPPSQAAVADVVNRGSQ